MIRGLNKRGFFFKLPYYTAIFIVLNLLFFGVMISYVVKHTNGKSTYEQMYAKEIAFMLDSSKAGSEIVLDLTKVVQKYDISNLKSAIAIDNAKKEVAVSFGGSTTYYFRYFSDNHFETIVNNGRFTIKIT